MQGMRLATRKGAISPNGGGSIPRWNGSQSVRRMSLPSIRRLFPAPRSSTGKTFEPMQEWLNSSTLPEVNTGLTKREIPFTSESSLLLRQALQVFNEPRRSKLGNGPHTMGTTVDIQSTGAQYLPHVKLRHLCLGCPQLKVSVVVYQMDLLFFFC